MKKLLLSMLFALPLCLMAETKTVISPDGLLKVNIDITDGILTYSVINDGKEMLMPSALGLKTDIGDFTHSLSLKKCQEGKVDNTYVMNGTKASGNHYIANTITMTFSAPKAQRDMVLEMQVSNSNIAYRYHFDGVEDYSNNVPRRITILSEASAFRFPSKTTTFICPQIDGDNKGWMGTKPSYEEDYKADAPMTDASLYRKGYTFPCLFHVGNDGWVLVSETGTTSSYCGCHLSDYDTQKGYTVTFPDATENHGLGSSTPAFLLPGETPWRTITVGSTLKPIAETTIPYDVVEEKYPLLHPRKPGRYTWSWLVWQDTSINYDDQVKFIDTAAEMGFEYCLVDNWWDAQIGRERIAQLSSYAQSKGVGLMLWYNSNGNINNAPQTPRNCMNTAIAREKEMAWLESIGVRGIKVDFFGGDKQETIRLYEDILSDANRHGIQVIFHGCTLPRGWEKMYPNFVASEAVLASENAFFSESFARNEGFNLTLHPFCRNAVATMDWGGTMMNHWFNKDNEPGKRHRRFTSDTFEMAAAITNQTSVQCIDVHPNNIPELQSHVRNFLTGVPTTWSETRFLDGYPTRYVVLARKDTAGHWYVAGLNGESSAKTLTLSLPMFAGKTVTLYTDKKEKNNDFLVPVKQTIKVDKNGNAKLTILPMGGIIITE